MKKQARDRKNLQNTYFGKECVYCIYKEPLQYNHKNKQPSQNMDQRFEWKFHQKLYMNG